MLRIERSNLHIINAKQIQNSITIHLSPRTSLHLPAQDIILLLTLVQI